MTKVNQVFVWFYDRLTGQGWSLSGVDESGHGLEFMVEMKLLKTCGRVCTVEMPRFMLIYLN